LEGYDQAIGLTGRITVSSGYSQIVHRNRKGVTNGYNMVTNGYNMLQLHLKRGVLLLSGLAIENIAVHG
jgi:hypothetical protein